jgi:phosphoglycolate phosphatase-like HAD superfamily hydrolase
MPTFNSQTILEQLQGDVNSLLNVLHTRIMPQPRAALLRQPAPGSWSVIQCLDHLNSYGLYYLPQLEAALKKGEQLKLPAKPAFKSGWLGNYFTNLMQPQPDGALKSKMNAPKGHRPVPQPEFVGGQPMPARGLAVGEEVLDRARRATHPPARVERLATELQQSSTSTIVMPGVHRLLERLEQEPGVMLGLLTGNIAEGAALKLRSAGIDPKRFRVGAYGSDAAHRPHLPPIAADRAAPYFGRVPTGPEVVIIGDTPADIACGECINARAIAVATGGYTRADLLACRPYAVFPDLSDTERVLTSILQ